MEGRQPPPKASHPFPGHVDFKHYWSHKETVRGFLRFSVVAAGGGMAMMYIYHWFSKDYPYVAFMRLNTPEEQQRRIEALDKKAEVTRKNRSLVPHQFSLKMDNIITEKPNVQGLFADRNIVFDDDIIYTPGSVVRMAPVPENMTTEETKTK